MKKYLLTTALATVMSLPALASTFEVPAENLRVSSRVQDATLSFESGEFTAHINGTAHPIDALDVRGLPAALQEDQLRSFLAQGGYLQLNPVGEEDYSLDARMRGLGGVIGVDDMVAIGLSFLFAQEVGVLMDKYQVKISDLLPKLIDYLSRKGGPQAASDVALVRGWQKEMLSGNTARARAALLSMKRLK